jgi:hypothetical protein
MAISLAGTDKQLFQGRSGDPNRPTNPDMGNLAPRNSLIRRVEPDAESFSRLPNRHHMPGS